ncbi:exonuclease domain-containing protein [Rhodococcoides corynebacterioides]|uniref:exonuclease domain-containing protein n=1 Tax=Rhodococcoides corynebacterioides TaxID=53972 RepID=UPI003AE0051B
MFRTPAASADRWVVVDVETSGLKAHRDRVLSVAAITLDDDGRVGQELSTLIDPGCDPGPVHIHGLTRERLRGAPRFDEVAPHLMTLLAGRTMVAHNASFDHGFLLREHLRAKVAMPTEHRLCTLALSRRLQPDLENHTLSTLARRWKVRQSRAHDAYDDARVLAQIFTHSARLARSLDLPLPVVACTERMTVYPDSIPRTPSPWRNPGPLAPAVGLVQGMRVVISGDTRVPRLRLAEQLTAAGLDVMNSVSRYTSVVVCSDPSSDSVKVRRAREHGLPVVSEEQIFDLISTIRPGTPKVERTPVVVAPPKPTPVVGPWADRRVLVMGGTHGEAVVMRSRLVQLGARPAVNLHASVSAVLILDGGDGDPRMPRVVERGLTVLAAEDVDRALNLDVPAASPLTPRASETTGAPQLSRGAVLDLGASTTAFTIDASWNASGPTLPVDVVAFLLTRDDVVSEDEDFVFYNAPATSDGAVALTVDGDCEQGVRLDLGLVPDDIERIVVAAAVDGENTFGDVGAVSLSVAGSERSIATAVLDAATSERTLLLTEVYRRGTGWRLRAIGQGYDDGLGALAVRYGVEVDD